MVIPKHHRHVVLQNKVLLAIGEIIKKYINMANVTQLHTHSHTHIPTHTSTRVHTHINENFQQPPFGDHCSLYLFLSCDIECI